LAENNQQPIIIKRIKVSHGGHHGGAWKVAFADFMTAMMAFFLVMWLVGQAPEVREAVAGHFRDPGKFAKQGSSGLLNGSQSMIQINNPTELARSGAPLEKDKMTSEEEVKALTDAAETLVGQLKKHSVFQKLRDNIKMKITSEGLRIILNESAKSPAFFEAGSAKLLQKSAVILMTIANELGHLDNRLVIEGHTDSKFGGSGAYTNWELSADRANAARQLLEVSGLKENQIREVRGFADQYPMMIEQPDDPRNRRVTILVLFQSREYAIKQIEVGEDLMATIDPTPSVLPLTN
jgi:chemotaxis protein MotB